MLCGSVRALLLAPEAGPHPDLAAHLESCASCAGVATALARLDFTARARLVASPPLDLQLSLAESIPQLLQSDRFDERATTQAQSRIDHAIRQALVIEPAIDLQRRLAALASADSDSWLMAAWRMLSAKPGVLAGQLAAAAVLGYAAVQMLAWLGSLPLVLGDVPYALELLLLSPAVEYLGQFETLLQQLALWLLVGAAGWLAAQGFSIRRQPEP